jgi:F-type H+-transporting ATPase subunit alpha
VAYFRSSHPDLLAEIRDTKQLPDTEKLDAAIGEFKDLFAPDESAAV